MTIQFTAEVSSKNLEKFHEMLAEMNVKLCNNLGEEIELDVQGHTFDILCDVDEWGDIIEPDVDEAEIAV